METEKKINKVIDLCQVILSTCDFNWFPAVATEKRMAIPELASFKSNLFFHGEFEVKENGEDKTASHQQRVVFYDLLFDVVSILVSLATSGFDRGVLQLSDNGIDSSMALSLRSNKTNRSNHSSMIASRTRDSIEVLSIVTLLGSNTDVVILVRHCHILRPLFRALIHWASVDNEEANKEQHRLLCLVLEAIERICDVFLNGYQFSIYGCGGIDSDDVLFELLSHYEVGADEWEVILCMEYLQEHSQSERVEELAFSILEKVGGEIHGVKDEPWGAMLCASQDETKASTSNDA